MRALEVSLETTAPDRHFPLSAVPHQYEVGEVGQSGLRRQTVSPGLLICLLKRLRLLVGPEEQLVVDCQADRLCH